MQKNAREELNDGGDIIQQFASLWGYSLFQAFWQASLVGLVIITLVKTWKSLPSNLRYGALIVALLKFTIPFMPPFSPGIFNTMQGVGKMLKKSRNPLRAVSAISYQHCGTRV